MKKNLILVASGILCMLISCKKGPETKSDMDEILQDAAHFSGEGVSSKRMGESIDPAMGHADNVGR